MGSPSDDMRQLWESIVDLRTKRNDLRGELQKEAHVLNAHVSGLLDGFREERMQAKSELVKELSHSRSGRTKTVTDITTDVQSLLKEFRKEMDDIGRTGKNERLKCINKLQAELGVTLAEANEKRALDAKRMRSERQAFRQNLGAFKADIRKRCAELREEVATLQKETARERADHIKEFRLNARKEKQKRRQFTEKLQDSVSGIMQECNTFRSEIITELRDMRAVWQGTRETPSPKAAPKATEKQVEVVIPPPTEKKEMTQAVQKDDLTKITGIGPERENQLNSAGVFSYAQLTTLTPEEIRQKLGITLGDKSLQLWITQAMELSSK